MADTAPLYTYNPKSVSITVKGVKLHGVIAGTFVEAERNEDDVQMVVGADGEVCRNFTNNLSGRLTVTLMASSDSNIWLQSLKIADRESNAELFPVFIKDKNSLLDIATLPLAWLVRQPNWSKAMQVGQVPWMFDTPNLITSHGALNKNNP